MASELTNYIEDDWNDNALQSRSNPEKGYFYQYSDGGTGDLLKGVYRPRWIRSGNNLQSEPSVTNGSLEYNLDSTNSSNQNYGGEIYTPSNISVGNWAFDCTWNSTNVSDNIRLRTMNGQFDVGSEGNVGDAFEFTYTASGRFLFIKIDNGAGTTLIDQTLSIDTSTHRCEISRDSYGNFEGFRDSSSVGTANDSFIFESIYTTFYVFDDNDGENIAIVDNFVIN